MFQKLMIKAGIVLAAVLAVIAALLAVRKGGADAARNEILVDSVQDTLERAATQKEINREVDKMSSKDVDAELADKWVRE